MRIEHYIFVRKTRGLWAAHGDGREKGRFCLHPVKVWRAVPSAPAELTKTDRFEDILNHVGALGTARHTFRRSFRLLLPWRLQCFGFLCAIIFGLSACRTTPLPSVNLQEPGWVVREGQAIWKRNKTAPEIAGELLLATRADGRTFIQFTKTPFPMIIAQRTTNRWQIEIPIQNKRFSGPGSPPKRLIWLYLPPLLAGEAPPKGWSWSLQPENAWRLENSRTGELLQGYLSAPQK